MSKFAMALCGVAALMSLGANTALAKAPAATPLPSVMPPEMDARYTGADWTYPSGNAMAHLFPIQAMDANTGGDGRIACAIAADGTLTTCQVLEESPAGMGFGQATAEAYQQGTRVDPKSVHGGIQPGDFRIFVYHWRLD